MAGAVADGERGAQNTMERTKNRHADTYCDGLDLNLSPAHGWLMRRTVVGARAVGGTERGESGCQALGEGADERRAEDGLLKYDERRGGMEEEWTGAVQ